jgi:hypothetical protein
LKCSNPGCGKLNPVNGDATPDREYNCVFCGHPFKAPTETIVETFDKKKPNRGKQPRQKTSRPENRNMTKPML